MFDICEVLLKARENGASDVYLKAGMVPRIRKNGKICEIPYRIVTTDDMLGCLLKITTAEQRNLLEERGECIFAYEEPEGNRYRVTVFKSRGVVSMVLRIILPVSEIAGQMGELQDRIQEIAGTEKGLVLFAGNAGSGRTGSMAAVIHAVKKSLPVHIVMLESPVEVIHQSEAAIISQRECGIDFADAGDATMAVLKEAADILVYDGKLDGELFLKLCQVSGCGVLVFASVYGKTLQEVVEGITTLYAPDEKDAIRKRMSEVLQKVVFCDLVESTDGCELKWDVVSVDAGIKNQIRNCL